MSSSDLGSEINGRTTGIQADNNNNYTCYTLVHTHAFVRDTYVYIRWRPIGVYIHTYRINEATRRRMFDQQRHEFCYRNRNRWARGLYIELVYFEANFLHFFCLYNVTEGWKGSWWTERRSNAQLRVKWNNETTAYDQNSAAWLNDP